MNIEQWRAQTIAIIGRPTVRLPRDSENALLNTAFNSVHRSFGPRHEKAASTCTDVLSALIALARGRGGLEQGIEEMTQVEIAGYTGWSANTVSRYTRYMEDLGLLRITREYISPPKGSKRVPPRRLPNKYYFTFVGKKVARPGGEAIQHPITTSIYYNRSWNGRD
jgi:hypothetical protein